MPATRRRALPICCLLLLLPLLLAGCLLDATPATPRPPTATPTPRPTPTATAQPVRSILPTATVAPAPTVRPTITALPASDPRAAGGLIYAGKINGRAGIIALRAGSGERRLLTEGDYEQIVWSPDGSRFAAIGALRDGPNSQQIALFTFNGRPLARYPFAGQIDPRLLWSPDGRFLLCLVARETDPPSGSLPFLPWVISETEAREITPPGERSYPLRWIARSRLAFALLPGGASDDPLDDPHSVALWTVEANGENGRIEVWGAFLPVGLSPDERTLYALGEPARVTSIGANAPLVPTTLVAIDLSTGVRRTIAWAGDLAATPPVSAPGVPPRWLSGGVITPDGARIALWLVGTVPPSAPVALPATGTALAIIATSGGTAPAVRPPSDGIPAYPSWSPDGTKLAYFLSTDRAGERELRILDVRSGEELAYQLYVLAQATPRDLAWSTDSRWVAYRSPRGLAIAATVGPAQSFIVAEDGVALAWRPERQP